MDKNTRPIYMRQESHFRSNYTYRLKVEGSKRACHENGNKKRAGVAILISDNIDFKTKTVARNKEGHYIMIKGSIQQEEITLVNIYAPNIGTPKYIKQILTNIEGDINSNTVIVGELNTHLHQWIDYADRKSISKHWL